MGWNDNECTLDQVTIFNVLTNASLMANFLNPNYVVPDSPMSAWVIKIYYQNTAYEFSYHMVGASMSIEEGYGERGRATFQLINNYDMPFIPVNEQLVEIWNRTENYLYFKGYITGVHPRFIRQLDDLTEKQILEIVCTDLYHQLERKVINKIYEGQTLGFILRDVIRTYTSLDHTGIDATQGAVAASFRINSQTPAQVLERILSTMDWTYWIDPVTTKLFVGERGSLTVQIENIDDVTLYDKFVNNEIDIQPNYDGVKNVIIMEFTLKYATGLCNVSNGSTIVLGVGTTWDNIPVADLKFQRVGSDAVYSVEKNNSAGVTQELRLSSAYDEATGTGVAYTLFGTRKRIRILDSASINMMAALRGDDGQFSYLFTLDDNAYTVEEAREIAQTMLALSRPGVKGQGRTNNHLFPIQDVRAGRTIAFNLPSSKRFTGDVIIQNVTITDTGAMFKDPNSVADYYPVVEYELDFTSNLFKLRSQLRKLMMDVRRIQISDDETVEDFWVISDTAYARDCLHVRSGFDLAPAYTEWMYTFSYYAQWYTAGTIEDPQFVPDLAKAYDDIQARPVDVVAYSELDYTLGYYFTPTTAGFVEETPIVPDTAKSYDFIEVRTGWSAAYTEVNYTFSYGSLTYTVG